MTDSELLNDYVSKRDEQAFAEIVLRYERLVWSICYRLLINHSDREDAFQNTFLVLAKNAHRIRKPDSMSNWLHSVAWRTASRIRKRRATLSLDEFIESGNEVADPTETQLDRISRLNEFELVNRQLHTMPEKHRTPLILFYFAGFSVKQISNQLNLSLSATEGRLRRAREKLRGRLQSQHNFSQIGESDSTASGAMLVLLAFAIDFESSAMLIATTVEKSLATTASLSAGATSGFLSLGTKLMICKYTCAASVTAILAMGGLMHSNTFQEATPAITAQIQVESDAVATSSSRATVRVGTIDAETRVTEKIPYLGDIPYVGRLFSRSTDGRKAARQSAVEAFHNHAAKHFKSFCNMIGCICCEQETP